MTCFKKLTLLFSLSFILTVSAYCQADYQLFKDDGLYGYLDRNGKRVIDPQYEDAWPFSDGLALVRINGLYGYIDKDAYFIIPPSYKKAESFKNGVAIIEYDGAVAYIDKCANVYRSEGAARYNIKRRFSKPITDFIAYELGPWDEFLDKKGIKPIDQENLMKTVECEINEWQQKGEFETTPQWKERVTEATRAAKAKEIADRILSDYSPKSEEAKKDYQKKYETLVNEYCDYYAELFSTQKITLKPYDADNQTFLISTEKYGDILLPVPLPSARAFKSNWENEKKTVKAVFVPTGNDIALQSVSFGDYTYDSNTKANYAQADLDYNFRPLNVDDLDFKFEDVNVNVAHEPSASVRPLQPVHVAENTHPEANAAADNDNVDIDIPMSSTVADNTFALVIANKTYAYASAVENAENDGKTVAKYLNRTLGIPQKNITTYMNATYGQMAAAISHLKDIGDAYGKDGFNIVFYYVGHGLPDDKYHESFILPVDVDPKNTSICYPLEKLYAELGNMGASSVTVMIDACFSGANHGDGMLIPQSMGVSIKPRESQPIGNMVVLSATQGDETAFPYHSKKHGLFTYWVLKKLQESKGYVTLGELCDFVTDNVKKTSVVENRKRQTPTVATSASLSDSWRDLLFAK